MNTLVIRTHRLGDVLQLTPMLEGLKIKYPGGRIAFLTAANMEDLLSSNPNVDDIITIPETKYRYYLREKPEYYAQVYNEMYDLVVELQKKNFQRIINRQYEVGSVLASLTGSQDIRGGAYSPQRGFFFDDDPSQSLYDIINKERKANQRNLVDWACHIAGVAPGCGRMTFCTSETDRMEADTLLKRSGGCNNHQPLAIQMGAGRSFRQWGTDNFVALIRWLVTVMNEPIVLLGTDTEKDQAAKACRSLDLGDNRVIDLTGKTTLKTLGGVLERCRYLITGDTGTMHMAAAVGTPVIAIFYGTAYPWETGPYGTGHLVLYANEPCAPCLDPVDCAFGHKCQNTIKPEHVCNAFMIAEGLSNNADNAYMWGADKVSLFITVARPGLDQVMIPIEEINRSETVGPCRNKPQQKEISRIQSFETCLGRLRNKGEQIMRQFYLGNMRGFLEALPQYVDQWSSILVSFNKGQSSHMHLKALEDRLVPVLGQACRAMEEKDYVTFVDLIRYQFQPYLASGILDIKAGGQGE